MNCLCVCNCASVYFILHISFELLYLKSLHCIIVLIINTAINGFNNINVLLFMYN